MITVIISENPINPESYKRFEVRREDVAQFIADYFGEKPETLRIYDGQPNEETEVTPRCESDIDRLNSCSGPVYALVMPADGGFLIAAVVASIAIGVGAALLLQPPIPTQKSGNFQQPSPNNSLSQRENIARIGKRIEDIYGTVRSTPTLISVPYRIYDDNVEKEIFYACIGRGEYSVSDIRDGETLISDIAGASVEVYAPFTSPNSASPSPQVSVGSAINRSIISTSRVNAVNGQTVLAPNSRQFTGSVLFDASTGFFIKAANLADLFSIGDSVTVTNASAITGPSRNYNLNGTFTITGITEGATDALQINIAGNSEWTALAIDGGATATGNATLTNPTDNEIGPFVVNDANMNEIYVNFVALNGLFKTDGQNQIPVDVTIKTTITQLDANGDPTGTPEVFNRTISGSAISKETIGVTEVYNPSFTGKCRISFERTSSSPIEEGFTIQDEVKVKDCYSVSPVSDTDFGNVTTIFAQIEATEGALAVKSRELNCLARRLVRKRNSDGSFTNPQSDYNAGDVLIEVSRDAFIGNRQLFDIDDVSIASAISDNISHFGSSDGAQFNYTFDDDNLSFEETFSTIAQSVFCIPYRVGSVLKLRFDGPQSESAMLFNHRNTLPGSEKRSVEFGNAKNYDGVELEYVEQDTGLPKTIFLPSDQDKVNRRKIETVGVTNDDHAYWHAAREWNKIRYQNTTDEREVLEHANLLVRRDRVLLADNTRPDTSDGEVLAQDGLNLTLSQPHTFLSGSAYTIWLFYPDKTVESISITAGSDEYTVVLGTSPSGAINTSNDKIMKTPYVITADTDDRVTAFLVEEIDPQGGEENTVIMRCINYDARYYQNDGDSAP